MSSQTDSEQTDDSGTLASTYRSVSSRYTWRRNAEMDSIGWTVFLGMVILLVPLVPFLVIVWVLEKLVGAAARGTRRD
jgi:hypothetical protein